MILKVKKKPTLFLGDARWVRRFRVWARLDENRVAFMQKVYILQEVVRFGNSFDGGGLRWKDNAYALTLKPKLRKYLEA